jgi:hypothetical protein
MQTATGFTFNTSGLAIPSRIAITQAALSSSWATALTVTPGAHTSITNTLENINNDFSAVTQTWAGGGTVATQRGTYFRSQTLAGASAQTFTNAYTVYIDAPTQGTNATITNSFALGLNGNLKILDGFNLVFDTTTGTKHGTATTQKQSFWNATPIVQPTTGVAAATFTANTSAIANDTATWDGYTVGQVVKALRNMGLLA